MSNWWKCATCHGTGREIVMGCAIKCFKCDGTGNAMVDGAAKEHQRQLDEIDKQTADLKRAAP